MGYTVYKHTSPSGKVYIGITSRSVKSRWQSGCGYRSNDHFFKAISKYGWDNFKHEILFTGLSKLDAEEKEIELIKSHKSTDPKFGYNITNGGKSANGYRHTDSTKKKISDSLTGIKHDSRRVENQRNRAIELWSKDDHRKKMSESHIGKHRGSNHTMSKPVSQFTLDGVLIRTFESVGDAERFTGIDHRQISDCCNGKQRTCHGFLWEYLGE